MGEKGLDVACAFGDVHVRIADCDVRHNLNKPANAKPKLTSREGWSDENSCQSVSDQNDKADVMSEVERNHEQELGDVGRGINLRAGDRPYIAPGALQLSLRDDGSVESGNVFLSVDPWLPDLSANSGTSGEVVAAIIRDGFPVKSICGGTINACQKSRDVRGLLAHPEATRLRHMVVIDGSSAIGVLDLDKARGEVNEHDPSRRLLVGEICEPLSEDDCIAGDAPLMEYILTAAERPFRVVRLANDRPGTVDVEDLQKLPVRILLFTKISHLETLLARRLCVLRPELLEISNTAQGPSAASLGSFGSGPLRRVEKLGFGHLLRMAKEDNLININGEEIRFLVGCRNSVAHGPRWYITRRHEISPFVNFVKKVAALVDELESLPN